MVNYIYFPLYSYIETTSPLNTVVQSQQCSEDIIVCDGHKDIIIKRQKEEIAAMRDALHQSQLSYKQLEHQNHCLLLHNHQLTVQVNELQKQIEISTLTRSASKNGIFLTTPV